MDTGLYNAAVLMPNVTCDSLWIEWPCLFRSVFPVCVCVRCLRRCVSCDGWMLWPLLEWSSRAAYILQIRLISAGSAHDGWSRGHKVQQRAWDKRLSALLSSLQRDDWNDHCILTDEDFNLEKQIYMLDEDVLRNQPNNSLKEWSLKNKASVDVQF